MSKDEGVRRQKMVNKWSHFSPAASLDEDISSKKVSVPGFVGVQSSLCKYPRACVTTASPGDLKKSFRWRENALYWDYATCVDYTCIECRPLGVFWIF